jgi:hypothetical protein
MNRFGAILLGAAGGALAGLGVWAVASYMIDKQFEQAARDLLTRGETDLRAEIDRQIAAQIPPRVRAEIDRRLTEANITPQTGQQLANALQVMDSIGLIGVRRRW